MKHWHPFDWSSLAPIARVAMGDVIHNPVYRKDCDETRDLAEKVDEALAKRGLKIDHAAYLIGFIEKASGEAPTIYEHEPLEAN